MLDDGNEGGEGREGEEKKQDVPIFARLAFDSPLSADMIKSMDCLLCCLLPVCRLGG